MDYKRPQVPRKPLNSSKSSSDVPWEDDTPAPAPRRTKPSAKRSEASDIDIDFVVPQRKSQRSAAPTPNPCPKAVARTQTAPQRKVKKLANPDPIVVYSNPNDTGRVIMSVEEYKGKQLINIRHQYRDRDGDGWTFGKGCSFPSSVAALEAIAAACEDLIPLVQEE